MKNLFLVNQNGFSSLLESTFVYYLFNTYVHKVLHSCKIWVVPRFISVPYKVLTFEGRIFIYCIEIFIAYTITLITMLVMKGSFLLWQKYSMMQIVI